MSERSQRLIRRSGYDRPGFAKRYDAYRPAPPAALLDVLCRLARVERPALVVDLGTGTGLSARVWAGRAECVVGVEPNGVMRAYAARATDAPNVEYVDAYADESGLPDGSADIVTCSQSLHWMEPEPTFAEAARILRRGGILAAYDYDVPPLVYPGVDAAFEHYLESRRRLRYPVSASLPKHEHLARMQASGRFRATRELVLHGVVDWSAEDVVGFALSLGPLAALLDEGVTEDDLGLARLREAATVAIGNGRRPAYFGYRIRVGVA
jgi:ubiquinone/menaquinone biosynthesis C-methylase UbiE